MKKLAYLAFCFVALGSFCPAMCSDDNEDGDGNNSSTYTSDMIVGTWRVENMTVNGEDNTPENMLFIMNEGGTGVADDGGNPENNDFTWSLDGDQLTIVPRHGQYVYTINSLTENECTFSGDNVPMADIAGDVVVHLVRVR